MFSIFVSWALARLVEPSTWSGLVVAVAGAAHLAVSTTTAGAIASAGASLAGAASVILKERGAA
jgi:hypothetical protein